MRKEVLVIAKTHSSREQKALKCNKIRAAAQKIVQPTGSSIIVFSFPVRTFHSQELHQATVFIDLGWEMSLC